MRELPVLPIINSNLILFPGQCCDVDVGRVFTINAINTSRASYKNRILVAFQRDKETMTPKPGDFYSVCVEAEIAQVTQLPQEDGQQRYKVILNGISRGVLKEISFKDEFSYYFGKADIRPVVVSVLSDDTAATVNSLREAIKTHFGSVTLKNTAVPENTADLSAIVDEIASKLDMSNVQKMELLKSSDPEKRLEKLFMIVSELIVQRQTNPSAPQPEDDDIVGSEVKKIEATMRQANLPPDALKIAEQELRRLKMMQPSGSEFQVTLNYLETLVNLPWSKSSEDRIDIDFARKCLDEDHYGLEKVKERILEFLAVKKLNANQKGSILCFVGAPGVGKTSSVKSIARSMNKEYIRMSLGGLHDEAEIRGHRKTYIGAIPGRIIQNLKKVGVNNPVFVLDEIDKVQKDYRGDPASALLEVLDPEQNNSFQDNYLGTPFDLSKVFFITTANDVSTIPPALRDRLEIIEIPGYSPFDKLKIAINYLIPKQKKENGLENVDVSISENAISKIIDEYTFESGVRSLERQCGTVMRKVAVMVASDKKPPTTVNVNMIPKLLGPPKTFADKAIENPTVGVSTGLAWSSHGGSILFVESMLTPGKGNIKVTGNAGKVLQESADAAFTWIRSHATELGVDLKKAEEHDIHIHLPAGATPKDGPSAGIAMTASLLSTLTNLPVNNTIAMTGEISLRGRVLPIGGLKEKTLAAHRAGIKTVLFPKDNIHDLEDIPEDVKNEIEMVPVSELKEAIGMLLDINFDVIVLEDVPANTSQPSGACEILCTKEIGD